MSNGSAGAAGFLASGIYNVTQPTYTDGQQGALRLDVNGNLLVSLGGSGGGGAVTVQNTPTTPLNVTGAVSELVTSLDWNTTGTLATGSLTATMQAAPGNNLYASQTDLTLSWGALTNAVTVSIKSGNGGTVLWSYTIPAATTGSHSVQFRTPKTAAVNTLLQIATTDPGASGTITWAAGGNING